MASPRKKWLRLKAAEDATAVMAAATTTTAATTTVEAVETPTEAPTRTSKTRARSRRSRTTKKDQNLMKMDFDGLTRKFLEGNFLHEGKTPDINSYIQTLGEILDNFRPKSVSERRRLDVAQEQLREIKSRNYKFIHPNDFRKNLENNTEKVFLLTRHNIN